MAKFLNKEKAVSELKDLIRKADQTLILISPYLKLSYDFKELLTFRNENERITSVIFGKQELNPDEVKFLQGLRFVILKYNANLHAKCYVNDEKMIITSLNLYEFSMANNKEMGVLIDKNDPADHDLYCEAYDEVEYINKTSQPFEVVSKAVGNDPTPIKQDIKVVAKTEIKTASYDGKYLSATAISKELGIASKDLNSKFEQLNWIERKNDDWVLTPLGKSKGAQMKKGQYGEYIAWPEIVIKEI